MNGVNTLVICKDNFEDEYDFFEEISNAIKLLLNNDYIMTVRYDANDKEMGIICIDYEAADESWGAPYPHWLTPKEVDLINYAREGN